VQKETKNRQKQGLARSTASMEINKSDEGELGEAKHGPPPFAIGDPKFGITVGLLQRLSLLLK
jgi:hypothetical protein